MFYYKNDQALGRLLRQLAMTILRDAKTPLKKT